MKKGMGISILCMVFLIGLLVSGAFAVMMGTTAWEENTNRPGMDYKQMEVQTIEQCQNACKADQQCKSFTLVKPMNLQSSTAAKCMLKNGVPTPQTDKCCTSGLKTSAQASNPLQAQQKSQQQMPPASSVTLPPEQKAPNISTVNGTVIVCPDSVTVYPIEIGAALIKINTSGFIGRDTGNLPVTFKYKNQSMLSTTVCMCNYESGEVLVSIQANLAGYTGCNVGLGRNITLYK
jgi:hypothetical protein